MCLFFDPLDDCQHSECQIVQTIRLLNTATIFTHSPAPRKTTSFDEHVSSSIMENLIDGQKEGVGLK